MRITRFLHFLKTLICQKLIVSFRIKSSFSSFHWEKLFSFIRIQLPFQTGMYSAENHYQQSWHSSFIFLWGCCLAKDVVTEIEVNLSIEGFTFTNFSQINSQQKTVKEQ